MSALKAEHDLHRRRRSRNLGVGGALLAFVALVFALSIVKMQKSGPVEGYDHALRPSLTEPSK